VSAVLKPAAMHEPLSKSLAGILADHPAGLTLNSMLQRTGGRGLFLVVIVLSLPFVIPVSIPGSSTVAGVAIMLLSARLAFGRTPRLPRFMGGRPIPADAAAKLVAGGIRVLQWIEKLVRPRPAQWLHWRPVRFVNALLLVFMGFLLCLPFPPLPPFTNSLPAYSIILLASSMMEEDGVVIWISYALSLVTIAYLVVMAGIIEAAAVHFIHFLQNGGGQ
jgi:hypothetical protein